MASCRTACAENQANAELDSVKLALEMASYTKSLLQHLSLEQLAKTATISLKTSSLHMELDNGRPLAMQLGLSRRNKHLKLKGQLQLSRVLPNKNLAHSLTDNASDKTMLAKLRIDKEAAETVALSTVLGQGFAFSVSSSSLLVGMVNLEPPKMESLQLRQLALSKSESCFESLSKNLADKSLASLTLPSLSLERRTLDRLTLTSWSFPIVSLTLPSLSLTRDRFHSLTWPSLSLTKGNSKSLTLQSLSLIDENRFQRISFKEVSFEDGSEKEPEESLAHTFLERRAGTNSFSKTSLQEKKPPKEAKTNSFSSQSFRGILSLNLCWRIFLLCSFQLVCAALLLGACSFRISFHNESLQSEELAAAYCKDNLDQQSFQQDELELACLLSPTRASQLDSLEQIELYIESFIHQLDLENSLSLPWFSLLRCSSSRFEQRALPCAALLYKTRIRNRSVQSFQLTGQNLSFALVSGGVHLRASYQPTWQTRTLTALTLISLSLAITAWLKSSSKRAWKRSPLRSSLSTASLPTTSFSKAASTTACSTTPFRTTSSLRRTFLWFSFVFSIFFSNSFRGKELVEHNELSQTVLEQELEELLANKPCPLDPLHDHLGQENLWQNQLQQNNLEKKKHKQKAAFSNSSRQRT